MTISNLTVKEIFDGNDSTTNFAIPFNFTNNSHVEVILRNVTDPESPIDTTQVLGADYTISGGDPGTTVVMVTAPTSNEKLIVRRTNPNTQITDYLGTSKFPAESHEEALDKLTRLVQELFEAFDRSAHLPKGTTLSELLLPDPVANAYLQWKSDRSGLQNVTNVVPDSVTIPSTSKGDLIGHNGSGLARVPVGSDGRFLQADSSDAEGLAWVDSDLGQAEYQNLGLSASVNANILTLALKQADGSTDPSTGTERVRIPFRSSTLTSGAVVVRDVASSTSLDVPDGATLGTSDGVDEFLYIYALDNSGTVELAVSRSKEFSEAELHSTTVMDTSSDDANTLYSTTARSNVPIKLLGRIKINEATAGTWATAPTDLAVAPIPTISPDSEIFLRNANGFGSTNTVIRQWAVVQENVGTDLSLTQSGTDGDSITINTPGLYYLSYRDNNGSNGVNMSITRNQTSLTTDPGSLTFSEKIATGVTGTSAPFNGLYLVKRLKQGDVIRASLGTAAGTTNNDPRVEFRIVKISN